VANGNSLEEGTRPMPFASHTLDEKSEQEDPFFFGTNAPAFDAAQGSRGRISAVYPVDRRPSRALTYLSRSEKNQFQHGLRRAGCRHQGSARRHLAGQLMDYDLGYFDLATRVLEPLENPFGLKNVTYVATEVCN
jgi:hypothetical protein